MSATRSVNTAPKPSRIAILRGRWPDWVGYAAAVWSLAYALLATYWAAGRGAFPFGVEHDPASEKVSILEHATPDTTAPAIAATATAATLAALVMARARARGPLHRLLLAVGVSMVGLALVAQDSRPLMALARTPIVIGGSPFGWPEDVGFFEPGMYSWPVANQLLIAVGGALWAATALVYARRVRGACAYCGRTDAAGAWTSPASAARWGRYAVAIAVAVPVLYAMTRWAWAAGIPLGVTREFLHEEARESPDIWLAGALLATVAVAGATLTLGLVLPFGEVYPRWVPYLGGKPVRPRTAILPGSVLAVLIFTAGIHAIRAQLSGYYPEDSGLGEPNWGTTAPGVLWPAWGAALAAALVAYHLRRRGHCARCSRL